LSAGDLLREERDSGSKDGQLITDFINEGKIVPISITVNLLKKAMQKHGWSQSKFLIDGFPRNIENEEGWVKEMEQCTDMRFVLFLDADE
jgi:UMP-CMP kinase